MGIRLEWPLTPLPKNFSIFVVAFYKIHSFWKLGEKIKIYQNPKNFLSLIGGHALHVTAKNSTLLKMAALSLLTIRRLQTLEEQITLTERTYQNLLQATKGVFGSPEATRLKRVLFRIKKISSLALLFFKETIQFTFRLKDLVDSLKESNSDEAIKEIFVNTIENSEWLLDKKEGLLKALKRHELILNEVTKKLNLGIEFHEVTSSLESTLKSLEKMTKSAKNLNERVAKKAIFGCVATFGLEEFIGDSLIEEEEISQKIMLIPDELLRC
jgi:hypothetical protein